MPRPPVIPPFRNATDNCILRIGRGGLSRHASPQWRVRKPMPGIPPAQTPEPMAVEESIRIPKRPGDGTLQIVPSNFRFKAFLKNL